MLIIQTQQELTQAQTSDSLLQEEEIILKDVQNITLTRFNSPKLKKLYCFNVRRLELLNHAVQEVFLFWCDYELHIQNCNKLEHIKIFESSRAIQILTALQLSDCIRILTIQQVMNIVTPFKQLNENLVIECTNKIKIAHEVYQQLLLQQQVQNKTLINAQNQLLQSQSIFSQVCEEESQSDTPEQLQTMSSNVTQGSNLFASRQISLLPLKKIQLSNPSQLPPFLQYNNAYEQAFIEETAGKDATFAASRFYQNELEIQELEQQLTKIMQQHGK